MSAFEVGQQVILNGDHPDYATYVKQSEGYPGIVQQFFDTSLVHNGEWTCDINDTFIDIKWENGYINNYPISSLLSTEAPAAKRSEIKKGQTVNIKRDPNWVGIKVSGFGAASTISFQDGSSRSFRDDELEVIDATEKKILYVTFSNGNHFYLVPGFNDAYCNKLVFRERLQVKKCAYVA